MQVIEKIAQETYIDQWEVFSELDELLEQIEERLAWQASR